MPREGQRDDTGTRLHWPRTFTARGRDRLRPAHLRHQGEHAAAGTLHCFVLDTSGSMLRDGRLALAKGVLHELMRAAARRRERVALLCFAGHEVTLRVPPGRPGAWRDDWIAPIAGGGGTPVSRALARASQLLQRDRRRHPSDTRWVWLLTDGRSREQPACPDGADRVRVVDFDDGPRALHRSADWVRGWGAAATWTPVADVARTL